MLMVFKSVIIFQVTIFHWDLPQSLQDLGGLTNKFFVDIFVDYARLLFAKYGSRVRQIYSTHNMRHFQIPLNQYK